VEGRDFDYESGKKAWQLKKVTVEMGVQLGKELHHSKKHILVLMKYADMTNK
jgi:hypothetical protein